MACSRSSKHTPASLHAAKQPQDPVDAGHFQALIDNMQPQAAIHVGQPQAPGDREQSSC